MSTDYDDILGPDPLPIDPPVDERSEKAIQNDSLVNLSGLPNSIFWRQNTGQAWQGMRVKCRTGQTVRIEPGMVVLRQARPIKFGLEGSGDIMGASDGTPVAVELKTVSGRQRVTQGNFQTAWEKAGGIYVVARSPLEAVTFVRQRLTSRKGTT